MSSCAVVWRGGRQAVVSIGGGRLATTTQGGRGGAAASALQWAAGRAQGQRGGCTAAWGAGRAGGRAGRAGLASLHALHSPLSPAASGSADRRAACTMWSPRLRSQARAALRAAQAGEARVEARGALRSRLVF